MAGVPLYAQFINLLAAILLLLAFAMLAQRRVLTLIDLFALQGLALAALDRHHDAAAKLAQAARRDRPTAEILCRLAEAELRCGRVANAQASLQEALALDPGHVGSRSLWSQMGATAASPKAVR